MAGASCGLSFMCPADLPSAITVATKSGYDFVCVPIVHPRYRMMEKTWDTAANLAVEKQRSEPSLISRGYPFTRSDLLLSSSDWSTLIVGLVSRHVNIESGHAETRRAAEEALNRELNFCSHLGLAAIMLPLKRAANYNLCRIMYSFLSRVSAPKLWIQIAMRDPDSWSWWNAFRSCANFDTKMFVALTLDRDPPSDAVLNRWLGEPVKALVVPTNVFLTNKAGFPVLPRSVQAVVRRFLDLKVQFIIQGRNFGHDFQYYQKYMDNLVQTNFKCDPLQSHASGYEDFLQSPLQPLMDNLESGTYEVFEKDPVKYSEYQKAIMWALRDRVTDEQAVHRVLVVMVLGAGRGPLVRAALSAAQSSNRRIKVFAVEKNPNAVVTLLTEKEETWHDQVEVISSDMRDWKPQMDDLADIVVSELLGSFGDNELSPECLYSAQHLFKPDAVSIPCSYTSWLGPVQSPKLYQEVRASFDREKNPKAHYETPYVVHLQNRTELAAPKPLFTFHHPVSGNIDCTRYGVLTFNVQNEGVLHGFAGYFECTLYKDIKISTNPATHSPGMFSWFPIFFPLCRPVSLSRDCDLEVRFWRLANQKVVWYEWCVTKPVPVPIHNPNGRSYTIGL